MTKTKFNRHPQVIAMQEWQQTDEFAEASNPDTLGAPLSQRKYLENRLKAAFASGWEACEKAP